MHCFRHWLLNIYCQWNLLVTFAQTSYFHLYLCLYLNVFLYLYLYLYLCISVGQVEMGMEGQAATFTLQDFASPPLFLVPSGHTAEVIFNFPLTLWLDVLKTSENCQQSEILRLMTQQRAVDMNVLTLASLLPDNHCWPIVFGGGKLLPRDFACVIITAVANLILKASLEASLKF